MQFQPSSLRLSAITNPFSVRAAFTSSRRSSIIPETMRVLLHESCEQRAHADYDVCNDVRTHYVVAGAELTPQLRVVDDVAAVRGVVLMGEIVLLTF